MDYLAFMKGFCVISKNESVPLNQSRNRLLEGRKSYPKKFALGVMTGLSL